MKKPDRQRQVWLFEFCGRGERIRTSGLYVPNGLFVLETMFAGLCNSL